MAELRNLNRLVYFVAVIDHGGFTQAAERLGVNKALVSRQVASLEEEVGAKLLLRSTRHVEPTQAGLLFHQKARQILSDAEDAFTEIAQDSSGPRGILRVTAPHDYGNSIVVPTIVDFLEKYPECRVNLSLNDQTLDVIKGNFDLSIRVGWLLDSGLKARRIGTFKQMMVAPPAFADRLAGLSNPQELTGIPFIANAMLRTPARWTFSRSGFADVILETEAILTLDTTQAVHTAISQGVGIGVMPDFAVTSDIASGALVPVLPDWELPAGGIYLVFPTSRFRPSRVTAFIDLLVARHKADQG